MTPVVPFRRSATRPGRHDGLSSRVSWGMNGSRACACLLGLALVFGGCTGGGSPGAAATPGPSQSPPFPPPSASPASAPAATAPVTPSPTPTPTPGPTISADDPGLLVVDVPRAVPNEADALLAAAAIDAFAIDLYYRVAAGTGNLVFSPTSIEVALAMARAGARGETAAQMDRVLHSAGGDELAAAMNALDQALTTRNQAYPREGPAEPPEVTLHLANAPFLQADMPFEAAFLRVLAERYGAGVRPVDFEHEAEAARRTINAWVKERTEGRIPQLLGPATVDSLTRFVLVNAIYLKASWEVPFKESNTMSGRFTRADGSRVQVPFLRGDIGAGYGSGAGWRAVEIPYIFEELTLTVIVPDDLAAFERQLTPAGLERLVGGLQYMGVRLRIPRFRVETSTELGDVLKDLGMPLAFDRIAADFSGISRVEALGIALVVHQANLEIDEAGTEAAAASAVVGGTTGSGGPPDPTVTFTVDRPFLFVLRDRPTGAILFIGRITDPSR